MSKKNKPSDSSQQGFRQRKTREEIEDIINAVLDPEASSKLDKNIFAIPSSRSEKADFKAIASNLKIDSGSVRYRVLELYCREKKAGVAEVNILNGRIENWANEQLKVLELICCCGTFTKRDILGVVDSVTRLGTGRILTLRAFLDLEGPKPGPLHQFFRASLPPTEKRDLDQEEYERQIREKMITQDQVNVFYNILSRVPNLSQRTAIELLPKARQLRSQHIQMINTFLKESNVFADKPIADNTILGMINLWLTLPEISDKARFKRLVKRLSRLPDQKKKDFQYLIHAYKQETEIETGKAGGKKFPGIRSLFS